jgi:hypothetical protein
VGRGPVWDTVVGTNSDDSSSRWEEATPSIRFPWVAEDREPNNAEREAAALASAALIASRRVMTDRANESKVEQENAVKNRLIAMDFQEVPRRKIATLADAPGAGEFCGETEFGNRRADLVV